LALIAVTVSAWVVAARAGLSVVAAVGYVSRVGRGEASRAAIAYDLISSVYTTMKSDLLRARVVVATEHCGSDCRCARPMEFVSS